MPPLSHTLQHLRRLAQPVPAGDRHLLAAFAARHDEAAFAELVRRHGPLIRGVCRRVLGDAHAADDAFQATFLLLARKAGAGGWGESAAGWLHATAWHVAIRARRAAGCRRRHEANAPSPPPAPDPLNVAVGRELCDVLDAELARLSERLRAPLVLCYLEGRTRDEAARQLGWSLATLKRRLERGRAILRARLESYGLSPLLLAAALERPAVPVGLAQVTTEAARTLLAGGTVAASVGRLLPTEWAWLTGARLGIASVVLTIGGLTVGVTTQNTPATVPPPAAPVAVAGQPPARADRDALGDPLPRGAVARLGTVRLRHGEDITSIALSADGKRLLSVGRSAVRLWDATTGQELMPPIPPQVDRNGPIGTLTPDGREIVTLAKDQGALEVAWIQDGGNAQIRMALQGESTDMSRSSYTFSPDLRTLAVHEGGTVRLWDLTTGKRLARLTAPLKDNANPTIQAVAFSADGRTVVTADSRPGFQTWDAATGDALRQAPSGEGNIQSLALSSDGRWVASTGWVVQMADGGGASFSSRKVRIWDTAKGEEARTIDGAIGKVFAAPDGRTLLAMGEGLTAWLRQWDLTTGRLVRTWPEDVGIVQAVAGSADGAVLATAHYTGAIRLWNMADGRERLRLDAHVRGVYGADFTPGGQTVLTDDGQLREWDAATGRLLRRIETPLPFRSWVMPLVRSRNGRMLATVVVELTPSGPRRQADRWVSTVYVLDAASGRVLHKLSGHDERIGATAFSPDGRLLASGDYAATVRLWDTATGQTVRVLKAKAPWLAGHLAFTPDGSRLLGLSIDHGMYVWETATGREIASWHPSDTGAYPDNQKRDIRALGLAVTPDADLVALGVQELREIVVCEAQTGKVVRRITGLEGNPSCLEFAPNGKVLASGSFMQDHVRLWDVTTGRELKGFPGHRGRVLGLAFSPDGRRLVSASEDGTALVWDVSDVRPGGP